jgi:hypothetical protein
MVEQNCVDRYFYGCMSMEAAGNIAKCKISTECHEKIHSHSFAARK